MKRSGRGYLFLSKLIFTFMIIAVYCIGRSIPLYGIDMSAYDRILDAGMLLEQSVGGDIYKCSILTLGISPYMISSILIQIINACRPAEVKSRTSAKRMNRLTMLIMLVLAVIMAVLRLDELVYVNDYIPGMRLVSVFEMVTGAFVILWLSERNKKYGIGGQTALIFVNIVDSIIATIKDVDHSQVFIPLIVSAVISLVMLFMENAEKRIPVQRISIHSIYSDKNYQAIKLNPVGVMPIMFTSAAFMLPKLVADTLANDFPDIKEVVWFRENLVLDKPLGIGIYIGILFLLNVILSYIMISPKDMTEQFLKSGDSLAGIHPGKATERYLRKHIMFICIFSSCVMGGCTFVSLILQMMGALTGTLAMLPTSCMILMGLWGNLYKEGEAVFHTDSYKTFI